VEGIDNLNNGFILISFGKLVYFQSGLLMFSGKTGIGMIVGECFSHDRRLSGR